MKHFFFGLLSISLICFAYANELVVQTGTDESISGDTIKVNQDIGLNMPQDLKNIKASFCNDPGFEKKPRQMLKFIMRPGERNEICLAYYNMSEHPIALRYTFGSGYINKDGSTVCDADDDGFRKYIVGFNVTGFTVPPKTTIIKRFMFRSSINNNGIIAGCADHRLDAPGQNSPGSMLNVISHNVGYINIYFTGDIYRLGRVDDVGDYVKTNKQLLLKTIIGILTVAMLIIIFKKDKKLEAKKQSR